MDYSNCPPEKNAKLKVGPGTQSIDAAADAWQNLARQLREAFDSVRGVLRDLDETWEGEAATLMSRAATWYAEWLFDAAAVAWAAGQALKSISVVHLLAALDTCSLGEIEANRNAKAVLASDPAAAALHAPEIARLDAEYEVFWGKNAQAMNYYATNVLDRMKMLVPCPLPPYITKEAGLDGPPMYQLFPRGDRRRFRPDNYHA